MARLNQGESTVLRVRSCACLCVCVCARVHLSLDQRLGVRECSCAYSIKACIRAPQMLLRLGFVSKKQ